VVRHRMDKGRLGSKAQLGARRAVQNLEHGRFKLPATGRHHRPAVSL